jgi:hypothetical protein
MKRITTLAAMLMILCGANGQLYIPENGLSTTGSGTSKTVAIGGTLNDAATSIDFGSSFSNSKFLFKKGSSNYLFVDNNGKIGIGTASPSVLVDITNGTNSFKFDPGTSVMTISGANGTLGQMPRMILGFNGDANAAFSFLTYTHDNLALSFDSYHNGSSWVSSSVSGNFSLYKVGTELIIGYKQGISAGTTFGGYELTDAVRFSSDGKLGIGGAPGSSKLFVNGTLKVDGTAASQVQFTGSNPYNPGFVFNGTTSNLHTYTFDSQNFSVGTDGNTRIGNGSSVIFYNNSTLQPYQQSMIIKRSWPGIGDATSLIVDNDVLNAVPSTYRIASFKLTGTEKAWIDQTGGAWFNGIVSIGTNLTNSSYKLFVETGIRTRKVRVDQQTWPDYVFHQDYDLLPLTEVEKFIQKNNHLPEVPSSKEVEQDGLDLGDNQSILLKKIEELTLYIIDQNKKIEEQQQQIKSLQQQQNAIKNLQEELEKIKMQLGNKK